MSQLKFTPINSSLLARKGDAVPSAVAPKPSLFWTKGDAPAASEQNGLAVDLPPRVAKQHRMMVTLSASEFEKLGIAAVKKGVTRHQIVRDALNLHLERLKCEFRECGCMTSGGPCPEGCTAG